MKLVIKIGGSLAVCENGPDMKYLKKLVPVIVEIRKKNQMIVSIGGGRLVRKYYDAIKDSGIGNEEMECVGIDLIRANVRFLSFLLDMKPIFKLEDISAETSGIIGGIQPGRSTDANAALAAERIGADMIIKLTNVDGVYDKDPKKFPDAKKIDRIQFKDVMKYATDGKPGDYGVFDRLALQTIKKHKIKTAIINGNEPENIVKVLNGERVGTWVE